MSSRPATTGTSGRRLAAVAVIVAVAIGLVAAVLVRSGGGGSRANGARAGEAGGPDRDLGPSAGVFGRIGRKLPSAADVLGALGNGISRSGLVRVEGRVVDALTRAPVGDVEVVFDGVAGETTAAVDADGNYRVDVTPGEYRAFVRGDHVISVGPAPYERLPTAPDPTTASAPDGKLAPLLDVRASQRGVDLEVQRSGVVTGRVLDPGGRAVEGAVVRAETGGWVPVLGTNVAETDAAGRYRLEVPAGFYELSAAHADYAGASPSTTDPYAARPSVTVFPAMETEQDLTMARGCVITGRAVRRDGSAAGAGALERGVGDTSYPAGPLADDGTFRYATLIEEEVALRAWPWKSPPAPFQRVPCKSGARFELVFEIPDDPPDLSGVIVDAGGSPAPFAFVDIYGLTPGTMNQQERADATGAWGVYALPDGEYAISAHVPGLGVARARVTVPAQGVTLRLGGTGAIAGRIAGIGDGETFQLEISGCNDGAVVMSSTTRLVPVTGGAYHVDGLPACTLVASARGPERSQMVEVMVVAGDTANVDLDLSPPRTKTVRLHVTAPDGSPVSGAQAMAMSMTDRAPATSPVLTDVRGDAELQARVGDQITVFTTMIDADEAMIGQTQVSDAPGGSEDIALTLSPMTMYSP